MRVICKPDAAQIRLGALRVLLSMQVADAFEMLSAHHRAWWSELNLSAPPYGAPQPSKRAELMRMPVTYGLVTSVGGPLTSLGHAFRVLSPWSTENNPYLWTRESRFGGVLVLIAANGDLLRHLLADWPDDGIGSSRLATITRAAIGKLAAVPGTPDPLLKLKARVTQLSDSHVREKLAYPYLEPLREIGLLENLPQSVGATSLHFPGYRLTRSGARFAAALSESPSADAILLDGIGKLALAVEGIEPIAPAAARNLLRLRRYVPIGAWTSDHELSVALLAWVAQGVLLREEPGIWTDPKSTNDSLRRLGELEHNLIAIHKGQTRGDPTNVVFRERLLVWERGAENPTPTGGAPVISDAGASASHLLHLPPTAPPVSASPPLVDAAVGEGEKPIPASPSFPSPDTVVPPSRRHRAWLALLRDLAEPLSNDSLSLLIPAGPIMACQELEKILLLPKPVRNRYRALEEHPLAPDRAFVWQGPGRPLPDDSKAARNHPDHRKRKLPEASSLFALASFVADGEPVDSIAEVLRTWSFVDEPAVQMRARLSVALPHIVLAVTTAAESVRRWLDGDDPDGTTIPNRVRLITALLLHDAVERGHVCRVDVWAKASELLRSNGSTLHVDAFLRALTQAVSIAFQWSASAEIRPFGASADWDRITGYLKSILPSGDSWPPATTADGTRYAFRRDQHDQVSWREVELSGETKAYTQRGADRDVDRQIGAFRQLLDGALRERIGPEQESRVQLRVTSVSTSPTDERQIAPIDLALTHTAPSPINLFRRMWLASENIAPGFLKGAAPGDSSVVVVRACRRLALSEATSHSPADRLLTLWIAIESAVQPVDLVDRRTLGQRLAAAAVLSVLSRTLGRAARYLLADSLSTWFRAPEQDPLLPAAALPLARRNPGAWNDLVTKRGRLPLPQREAMSLDAHLAPFMGTSTWCSDLHLIRDVAEHSNDWNGVVDRASADRSADAWEVAEWIRVTRSRRDLAEFLRNRWLEAVAFLERLYRLRNRVVHEAAGLDSRDEPVFDEMAARGFAVFQPLLQRLSESVNSDSEAEGRWEQAVLYMREATYTTIHGSHLDNERERTAKGPADGAALSRWFAWPAPPGPPMAE